MTHSQIRHGSLLAQFCDQWRGKALARSLWSMFFWFVAIGLAYAQPGPPPLNLSGTSPIVVTPSGVGSTPRVVSCPTCGTGTGNVNGPGSAVSGHVATFNGTTGKLIQDGGAAATGTVTSIAPGSANCITTSPNPITGTGTVDIVNGCRLPATQGVSPVTVDGGAGTLPSGPGGFPTNLDLAVAGADNIQNVIGVYSFGSIGSRPAIAGFRGAGSRGSPTSTVAGSGLLGLQGWGWDVTGMWNSSPSAEIILISAQNFTSTARGTDIEFLTTALGSANDVANFVMKGSGAFLIGTLTDDGVDLLQVNGSEIVASSQIGTPTGGNKGAGTLNAQGLFINGAAVGTGSGSVTSVAATVPASLLTVSGSPVTTSGTLAFGLAAQTANTLFGAATTTPSWLALPSCSAASSALTWTTGTGFGCNTISAGAAFPITAAGATQSVGQMTVTGSNAGMAIVPNGTGALMLAVPDATSAGGNARGSNAIDLQMTRGAATQVASGTGAIAIGGSNTASGGTASTIAIGSGNANSGGASGTIAIGDNNSISTNPASGAIALGASNTTTGTAAAAIGFTNTANAENAIVIGERGSNRSNSGVTVTTAVLNATHPNRYQKESFVFWQETSGASAVRLTTDGAAAASQNCGALNVAASAAAFSIRLAVLDTTTPTLAASYVLSGGLISRPTNAASTVLGTGVTTFTPGSAAGGLTLTTAPTVTADTTNACLNITFTPNALNTDTYHIDAVVEYTYLQ